MTTDAADYGYVLSLSVVSQPMTNLYPAGSCLALTLRLRAPKR